MTLTPEDERAIDEAMQYNASGPDWADVIAHKIIPERDVFSHSIREAIAPALRRAKAEGMREAAKIALNFEDMKSDALRLCMGEATAQEIRTARAMASLIKGHLRARADEIEKGA